MARLNNLPQVYGILGENIAYSLSPTIFKELFHRYRVNACYTRFDIPPRDLKKFIAASRLLPLAGFNVTTPHKEAVAKDIDASDPVVRAAGATNLVIVDGRQLRGYNTDLDGIRATIEKRLQMDVHGKSALLIGSGGAARTALYYLGLKRVATATIATRNSARARRFRSSCRALAPATDIRFASLGEISLTDYDVCINCTPISTLNLLGAKKRIGSCAVFDLSYVDDTPIKARRYADGKYMLAAQAARNFEIMTGIAVTIETVLKIINRARRK